MKALILGTLIGFLPLVSNGAKKWTDFSVEHDQTTHLNYGTQIFFKFYVTTKKGKKEPLKFSQTDKLTVNVVNGGYEKMILPDKISAAGILTLMPYPKTIQDTVTEIEFILKQDDTEFKKSFRFRLNYKGSAKISFKGFEGKYGGIFEKPREVIVHSSSNDGENGGNGDNGKDISAIFQKMNAGYPDSFYVCRIITLKDNMSYEYKITDPTQPLTIDCRGGDGGRGGNGTSGTKRNRYRVDGGNGGNGGTGGNGGSINIKIRKNATEIKSSITCLNNGGKGGNAGMGGKGVEHKTHDPELSGKNGTNGLQGLAGQSGGEPVIEIID